MAQMIRTYKAEGKRPYKVEVSGEGIKPYVRHTASEKAALTMANNIARHANHFGIETDVSNEIWEPCEERDLRRWG